MDEGVKSLAQSALEFWPVISTIGIFLAGQVLSYIKLKSHVDGLLKGLNGVGQKLKSLDDKVDECEIENILRMSEIQQRISRIEGMLEAIYKPKIKNGEA